jgi:hypothetical protein
MATVIGDTSTLCKFSSVVISIGEIIELTVHGAEPELLTHLGPPGR